MQNGCHHMPRGLLSAIRISAAMGVLLAGSSSLHGSIPPTTNPAPPTASPSTQPQTDGAKGGPVSDDTRFAQVLHATDEHAFEGYVDEITGSWSEERAQEFCRDGNLLPDLVVLGGTAERVDEGLQLTEQMHQSGVMTTVQYRVPLTIEAVAKTNSTNIRLYYGRGMVIFNWECNPSELRYCEPREGRQQGYPGKGTIPTKQWQTIRWEIDAGEVRILVNGEPRLIEKGNFAGLKAHAAVGTAWGSVVTLKSLKVTQR